MPAMLAMHCRTRFLPDRRSEPERKRGHMSPCQLSAAEMLLPAASVIVWTTDQPADLEEAVALTLAALGLSGQQQRAAGFSFIEGPCVKPKGCKNAHAWIIIINAKVSSFVHCRHSSWLYVLNRLKLHLICMRYIISINMKCTWVYFFHHEVSVRLKYALLYRWGWDLP